jgi:L-fucose isomerase-like protein
VFAADLGGTWHPVSLPAPDDVAPLDLAGIPWPEGGPGEDAGGTRMFAPPAGMPRPVVDASCRLATALLETAEAAGADAVSVRCQSDEVASRPGYGVMGCLGVSLLASRGIPATCTGDMVTAVAMFLATRLGGAAQYLEVDGPDRDRDALLLSNGGELDLRWARAGSAGLVTQQFFSGVGGRGLALRGLVPAGPATLIAFTPDPDGWRLVTLEGEVLEEALPAFPVPHAFLRSRHVAADAFRMLGDAGAPHHVTLTPGHVADVVAALCTLVPIRHVAL